MFIQSPSLHFPQLSVQKIPYILHDYIIESQYYLHLRHLRFNLTLYQELACNLFVSGIISRMNIPYPVFICYLCVSCPYLSLKVNPIRMVLSSIFGCRSLRIYTLFKSFIILLLNFLLRISKFSSSLPYMLLNSSSPCC